MMGLLRVGVLLALCAAAAHARTVEEQTSLSFESQEPLTAEFALVRTGYSLDAVSCRLLEYCLNESR